MIDRVPGKIGLSLYKYLSLKKTKDVSAWKVDIFYDQFLKNEKKHKKYELSYI